MTNKKYDEQEVYVDYDGKHLYGKLLMPRSVADNLPSDINNLSPGKGASATKHPLAIISHGFGSTHKTVESYAQTLAEHGIASYIFDFYGGSLTSKSGGAMTDMSVKTELNDVKAVLAAMRSREDIDTNNIIAVGMSQGGLVSALLGAERTDQLRALVLFYPALQIPQTTHEHFVDPSDFPEQVEIMNKPVGRRYFEDLWDLDAYKQLATFSKSILILHGDADDIVPIDYSRKAAQQFDNVKLVEIPNAGHGFTGQDRMNAAQLIAEFVLEQCVTSRSLAE